MKYLNDFCKANNLKLVSIRYKHQFGYCKRKGYDIVNPSNNAILASFEPCNYSNGDKWYLRNKHDNYKGPRYCKRITKNILSYINPAESSFIYSAK